MNLTTKQQIAEHSLKNFFDSEHVDRFYDDDLTQNHVISCLFQSLMDYGIATQKIQIQFCNKPLDDYLKNLNLKGVIYYNYTFLEIDEKLLQVDFIQGEIGVGAVWFKNAKTAIEKIEKEKSRGRESVIWNTRVSPDIAPTSSWVKLDHMRECVNQSLSEMDKKSLENSTPMSDKGFLKIRL